MRSAWGLLVTIVVAASGAGACGGEVKTGQSDGLATAAAEPTAAPADSAKATATTAPDGGSKERPNVATSGAAYDCLSDDVGASAPEQFQSLTYSLQTCADGSSACLDILTVQKDCTLALQVRNEPYDATLSPEDCARVARWSTSSLLAGALDTLSACSPGSGNPPEVTEVELVSGPGPRKKTGLCNEEPYTSHRACMASIRARYFPGL